MEHEGVEWFGGDAGEDGWELMSVTDFRGIVVVVGAVRVWG